MRRDPNQLLPVYAVCQPPAAAKSQNILVTPKIGSCLVNVQTIFDNGSSSNACPAGNCDCSMPNLIYGLQCGSLVASVYIFVDLAVTLSGPSVDTYLSNLGIGNVNTIYGYVFFELETTVPVAWSIDVWRNLEVIRNEPGDALLLVLWVKESCPAPSLP